MMAPPPDVPPAIVSPVPINHACLINASAYYVIPPELLLAIRMQEAGTVGKSSKNTNGTYDHGPMQINTVNLPQFAKFGVKPEYIRDDECTNIFAGAYLLRKLMNEHPRDLWIAVGEYHSATPVYRDKYIADVWRRLVKAWQTHASYLRWIREAAVKRRLEFMGQVDAEAETGGAQTIVR